jgi:hypothetical protein
MYWTRFNLSFKNSIPKITEKTGVVVSITATFVDEVNCNDAYKNKLNKTIPLKERETIGFHSCNNRERFFFNSCKPIGKRIKKAMKQRKNVMVTGGKSLIAFPIKIFPEKIIIVIVRSR